MGIFVGLLLGLGLFLILNSGRRPTRARRNAWRGRTRQMLVQAGMPGVSPEQLVAISVGIGVLVAVLVAAASSTWSLALAFGGFASLLPRSIVLRRRRHRVRDLRELWPDVVDNLASAVRAGMSLPEGLSAVAVRGPEQLRPAFRRFGEDYRATGSFSACLDWLSAELADPVADRIVESLRLAREVGGTDLGRLLRTLSTFLREDARTRAEIEARQSWTVSAARLAVAAPWTVLLLLATQNTTVRAYDRPEGIVVLALGAGVSCFAYWVMKRIGRLPEERRVLRTGTRAGAK